MDQSYFDPLSAPVSDDPTGQRNDSRDSLLLTAQVRHVGAPEGVQVRVRNLSSGGLMAELNPPLPSGTPVEVEVRGVGWVSGRVAWATDGRVGVAFDSPIDPKAARKPVGQGGHTPSYAKPVITRR